MLILIDNKSGAPIYDQIFTQIKGHIMSGELNSDEPLPSIRGLAKDLRISFITTKRSYEELEKEGKVIIVEPEDCFGMKTLTKDTDAVLKMYYQGYEKGLEIVRNAEFGIQGTHSLYE